MHEQTTIGYLGEGSTSISVRIVVNKSRSDSIGLVIWGLWSSYYQANLKENVHACN